MTLIEVILTVGLSVMVVSLICMLYAVVSLRSAQAITGLAAFSQTESLMADIEKTMQVARRCQTKTVGEHTAFQCQVSSEEIDRDGDGQPDDFDRRAINVRLRTSFQDGRYVTYYRSDSSGKYGNVGSIWWKAYRSDAGDPTAADVSKRWSMYNDGSPRYVGIDLAAQVSKDSPTLWQFSLTSRLSVHGNPLRAESRKKDVHEWRLDRQLILGGAAR